MSDKTLLNLAAEHGDSAAVGLHILSNAVGRRERERRGKVTIEENDRSASTLPECDSAFQHQRIAAEQRVRRAKCRRAG